MIKTVFTFLLSLLLFASILGYIIYKATDPDFLSQQTKELNLYGRLSDGLDKLIPTLPLAGPNPLSAEDTADILRSSIDSQTFYGLTDQAFKSYLPWLTGKTETLDFHYDLAPVKEKARAKATERLLTNYDNLPLCTSTQTRGWKFDSTLPACKLPNSSAESDDINRFAASVVNKSLINELPNSLSNGEPNQTLLSTRASLSLAMKTIYLVWLSTLALIALFILVLRRRAFLPLAWTFFLAGAAMAAFAFIAWDWVGNTVIDMLPGGVRESNLPVFIDLITALLGVLKSILANAAVVSLIMGAFFLLIAIFFRPRSIISTTKQNA